MSLKISDPFWQTIGVGTLAGMRTMSALVITSHILSHHHSKALEHSPLNFIQSQKVAMVLKVLAVSELVSDKMPSAPNRIRPMGVGVRCISGAVAGASIYKAAGGSAITGALLGSAAAAASTFASFFLRKAVVKKTNFIDPAIGFLEDALVAAGGATIITQAS